MKLSSDYVDLLRALNDAGADYLVVGAYAVIFHAEPRFTKDLDVWVRPQRDNAERVYQALEVFGAPLANLDIDDLCNPTMVFQIGLEPVRVDILMGLPGLDFQSVWDAAVEATYDGVPIRVMGVRDLIEAKTRANRPQDRIDVDRLRRLLAGESE
jgi:hypothetical protein